MTRTGATMGLLATLIGLAAAPALAQFAGERLAPAPDPAMRLAFTSSQGSDIAEYVAPGETVNRWTRMTTVQRFGYRPGLTAARFAESWLAGMGRACGISPAAPVPATLDGHPAVDARVDCPRNPQTGRPETVLARFVVGDQALHAVQAATRRAPNPADLAWANGVIAGATLCLSGSAAPRCR